MATTAMAPPAISRRRLPRAPAGAAMTASCDEVSRIMGSVAWAKDGALFAGFMPVIKSLIYIVYIFSVRCPLSGRPALSVGVSVVRPCPGLPAEKFPGAVTRHKRSAHGAD